MWGQRGVLVCMRYCTLDWLLELGGRIDLLFPLNWTTFMRCVRQTNYYCSGDGDLITYLKCTTDQEHQYGMIFIWVFSCFGIFLKWQQQAKKWPPKEVNKFYFISPIFLVLAFVGKFFLQLLHFQLLPYSQRISIAHKWTFLQSPLRNTGIFYLPNVLTSAVCNHWNL